MRHGSCRSPRYRYLLSQSDLEVQSVLTDKFQHSSLLWSWLLSFVRLWSWKWYGATQNVIHQNSRIALFGRTLFVAARKTGAARLSD